MKKIALFAFVLAANPAAAASMTVDGSGALALAAIVALPIEDARRRPTRRRSRACSPAA